MPDGLEFVAADGSVTNLRELPGVRALGDTGLDLPPVALVEDDVPQQPGSQLRAVNLRPREATIPFYLSQADELSLRTLLRTLARRFNPAAGDGKLRVTSVDGTVRELTCRYTEGLEGSRVRGAAGAVWRRGALVFRAFDPLFYDTTPQSQTYTTGVQKTFLSSQFLPLALTSDVILGSQTVSNSGDVEAWPVWTVRGPATSVKLTNVRTGQVIDLPITLTAAQTVVIDTRPFRKTVTRDDGTNLYGQLSTASVLWSLPTGDSTVMTELPGAAAGSFITLTYQRRWLTA